MRRDSSPGKKSRLHYGGGGFVVRVNQQDQPLKFAHADRNCKGEHRCTIGKGIDAFRKGAVGFGFETNDAKPQLCSPADSLVDLEREAMRPRRKTGDHLCEVALPPRIGKNFYRIRAQRAAARIVVVDELPIERLKRSRGQIG